MKSKKIKIILIISLCLSTLISCTADNDKKPLICRRLGFDSENGKILVTAVYLNIGNNTESANEETVKTFYAKDTEEAVKLLLTRYGDALYKPIETMAFGENLGEKTTSDLIIEILNQSDYQLKCSVIEAENANEIIMDKNKTAKEKSVSFSEYFREKINGGKLKLEE